MEIKRSYSYDSDSVELMTPTYDSNFRFSPGHKRSYHSDYDSIASENQTSCDSSRAPTKLSAILYVSVNFFY